MPYYLVHCPKCDKEESHLEDMDNRHNITMSCGHIGELRIGCPARYFPFREGWWENLDKDPVYIKSKKHLAQECEKRGLYSRYLMDN